MNFSVEVVRSFIGESPHLWAVSAANSEVSSPSVTSVPNEVTRDSGKWWRMTSSAKGERALFWRQATAILTPQTLAAAFGVYGIVINGHDVGKAYL